MPLADHEQLGLAKAVHDARLVITCVQRRSTIQSESLDPGTFHRTKTVCRVRAEESVSCPHDSPPASPVWSVVSLSFSSHVALPVQFLLLNIPKRLLVFVSPFFFSHFPSQHSWHYFAPWTSQCFCCTLNLFRCICRLLLIPPLLNLPFLPWGGNRVTYPRGQRNIELQSLQGPKKNVGDGRLHTDKNGIRRCVQIERKTSTGEMTGKQIGWSAPWAISSQCSAHSTVNIPVCACTGHELNKNALWTH